MSEQSTLRDRQAAADREADRLYVEGGAPPAPMLVRTVDLGNYPTAVESYFAVVEVDPGGPEVEGGDGTFTEVGETFFALHTGSAIPEVGTEVIVKPIGGRWVFAYG